MANLGQSSFEMLKFDENGALETTASDRLAAMLAIPDVVDLVVFAHGWKNDETDAMNLYGTLWNNACASLSPDKLKGVAVVGVLWPSKQYSTDFDTATLTAAAAGNALAMEAGAGAADLTPKAFDDSLEAFTELLGAKADATVAAARAAAENTSSTNSFHLFSRGAEAVDLDHSATDTELAKDAQLVNAGRAAPTQAQDLLSNLKKPPKLKVEAPAKTTLSLSDDVQGLIAGPRAAVARFLNQLTYFEMKKRAGVVGASLAENLLNPCQPSRGLRLHLVGHSFGARLVTAAANGFANANSIDLRTLTLLQGAFSHNSLAKLVEPGVPGAFHHVVGKPSGPITITHTHNDLACTLAYAIASRLSRDIAAALPIGDAQDIFGAMGANGPQKLEAGDATPDDTTQAFKPTAGKVNTILADKFILKTDTVDAHNNVTNPECGRLLASVISV